MKTKIKKLSNILGWIGCGLMGLTVIAMLLLKSSGEYHLYMVRSGSMAPAINTGDFVVTGPANGTFGGGLEPGKIITYVSGAIVPGKPLTLTTHRIVSIDGEKIIVKGDANKIADPQLLRGQVVGVYLFKIPVAGYINAFVHTRKGWLVSVILPALILISLIAVDIVKESLKPGKSATADSGGKRS